jgi:hypothetical protein
MPSVLEVNVPPSSREFRSGVTDEYEIAIATIMIQPLMENDASAKQLLSEHPWGALGG